MPTWIEAVLSREDVVAIAGNLAPIRPTVRLFDLQADTASEPELARLVKDASALAGSLAPREVEISGSGEILLEEDGNLYGVPVLLVRSYALGRLRNIIEDELMGAVISYDRSGFLPYVVIEGAVQLNGRSTVRVEETRIVQETNGTCKVWRI